MGKRTAVTTGEVAAHCQVTSDTVINWIKTGKLNAYTTPGGHRRIPLEEFRAFLQAYHMPPFAETAPARKKVLIVDDEPDITRILTRFLGKTAKYELAAARDGFEAGIQLKTFCPDVVILDLVMPQLDGFQVCKMLKSDPETAHIKVLVLTGYASDENLRKALESGADRCMAKPVTSKELAEKIEELFTAENDQTAQTA